MAGLLDFAVRFGTEERCIEHLAGLRWPGGFVCSGCGGRVAWRLKARPRVYECGTCHRQESVTAGTVFHRTRTDLMKWFLAAYLMGRDKRGVSAKFLQRELVGGYRPAATGAELGAFLKATVAARSHLLTDGFAGYRGGDAGLGEHLKHTPMVQGEAANAGEFFPIIHTLFSNIKAWLVGTHHGISAKHLPRYLREWSYRFNRRTLPDGLDGYLIRRAVECATITYDQLKTG